MNFEIILFLVHALIVLGKPAHQDEGMSFTVKHAGMKKKSLTNGVAPLSAYKPTHNPRFL